MEELLSVPRHDVLAEFERRMESLREVQRDLERHRVGAVRDELMAKAANAEIVAGVKLLSARVDGLASAEARVLADSLRQTLGSGIVILGRAEGEKASILVAVTDDLKAKIGAGDLVKELAKIIGGGGGGRNDLAEAGGKDPSRLDEALAAGRDAVARRVGAGA